MPRCLKCKKPIESGVLCSKCFRDFQQYEEETAKKRKNIMARSRLAKSRLKANINEPPDSTKFPLNLFPQDRADLEKQIEKEKQQKLTELNKQQQIFDLDPQDRQFQQYERELAECGGDVDTYYRKKGFKNGKPNKIKAFVTVKDGKLEIDEEICSICGKNKRFCKCRDKPKDEALNFDYNV